MGSPDSSDWWDMLDVSMDLAGTTSTTAATHTNNNSRTSGGGGGGGDGAVRAIGALADTAAVVAPEAAPPEPPLPARGAHAVTHDEINAPTPAQASAAGTSDADSAAGKQSSVCSALVPGGGVGGVKEEEEACGLGLRGGDGRGEVVGRRGEAESLREVGSGTVRVRVAEQTGKTK